MIDSHCHLEHPKFNKDLDEVIQRADKLKAIITLADTFSSLQKTLDISEKYEKVFSCLGMGPIALLRDNKINETLDFIRKNKSKFVAIGEVGLDYYWDKENHEKQKENFLKFIELANELKKPIVVHSREAELDAIEILEKKADTTIIMHSFEAKDLIKRAVDNNYFVGITTKACYSNPKSLINLIELDYMLTETDSPFLHPRKEGRNEPANVMSLIELIASRIGEEVDIVDKTTERNALRVFKIARF